MSPGAFLLVDNKEYTVEKWSENMGAAEIALSQSRGR
jgi:hypothetical protein